MICPFCKFEWLEDDEDISGSIPISSPQKRTRWLYEALLALDLVQGHWNYVGTAEYNKLVEAVRRADQHAPPPTVL